MAQPGWRSGCAGGACVSYLHNHLFSAMRAILVFSLALTLCAGCFFGDKVGTGKSVPVNIPSGRKAAALSADSPEVQEAVQLVSDLVVPYGLLRDTNAPPNDATVIAYFHDQYSQSWCRVQFDGDTLTTTLFEYGRGRASSGFRELSSQLRKELRKRYGFPKKPQVDPPNTCSKPLDDLSLSCLDASGAGWLMCNVGCRSVVCCPNFAERSVV